MSIGYNGMELDGTLGQHNYIVTGFNGRPNAEITEIFSVLHQWMAPVKVGLYDNGSKQLQITSGSPLDLKKLRGPLAEIGKSIDHVANQG